MEKKKKEEENLHGCRSYLGFANGCCCKRVLLQYHECGSCPLCINENLSDSSISKQFWRCCQIEQSTNASFQRVCGVYINQVWTQIVSQDRPGKTGHIFLSSNE